MSTEAAETSVLPGEVLAGKYAVTRVLGRGGMGVVVEARDLRIGERVAIKVLHAHYCNHPEAMARFEHEAKAAVRIRGEHSARLRDVGTTETGLPFIAMELLEGSDLATILRMGSVSMQEAVLYILQACEGMAEVHANGIIHRDLKPGNLFVTRRPDGTPLVKVLDFGIAKSAFPTDEKDRYITMTLAALGTPLYMSPEQVRSSRHVDARTDVWSLGAILYELVARRPAFGGNTVTNITAQVLEADPMPLTAIRPDVPPELERVVRKALAKRPEHRFVDMAAFALALAPFAGDIGRAHAERAARILRGEGRGVGAAPFSAPPPAIDLAPTATSFQSEETETLLTTRRQTRDRTLLGVLLGLSIAAVVIGYSVLSAYREQAGGGPALTPRTGIASESRSVTRHALAHVANAKQPAPAPPPEEPAPKKPRPTRGGGSRTAPAEQQPPPPSGQPIDDPAMSRRH